MKTIFSYIKVALISVGLATMMSAAMAADGTPGMITHDISSYPITPEMNACVMCHRKENSMAGASNTPVDHFKGTDGQEGDKVTQARYVCTACHAPAEPQK